MWTQWGHTEHVPKRAIYLPDDLDTAARSAGVHLSAVCQAALRAELGLDGGQAAADLGHLAEHEHPGAEKQLRALTAGLVVVGGVAVLALVVAIVALTTD